MHRDRKELPGALLVLRAEYRWHECDDQRRLDSLLLGGPDADAACQLLGVSVDGATFACPVAAAAIDC